MAIGFDGGGVVTIFPESALALFALVRPWLSSGNGMPVGEEVLIKTENTRVRVVELGPSEVALAQ